MDQSNEAQENFHFYASSVSQWMTTNPTRDIRQLLRAMDKDGYEYTLFYVPLKHDAPYKISRYEPVVEGVVWLGNYKPNAKR
jgi:hypothetical protein